MPQLISYNKSYEAIPRLFNHYVKNLRLGFCMSMTGSPTTKTGSGKTLTAAGIGSMVDPYFSAKKLGLSPSEFLQAIDSFSENTSRGETIPGQVAILDEGEITAPSTLWYSFTNRAIFYTLATFRSTRCIAIIITPSLKWIDSRMRTLLSFWAYTDKEYTENRTKVSMRMYRISTDMLGDKMYYRKIRMYDNQRKKITIFKEFDVKRPDPELEAEINEKAERFKVALRKDLANDVAKFERLSSYRQDGEGINLENIALKVLDNDVMRDTLFSGKAISVPLLRTILEREGTALKLGEAELLKNMIMKMYKGKKDV